jgi:helix-turn-helix protein
VFENLEKLPTLNDLNACKQTLIIFDDMVTDIKKHPIISEYFIRGRKKGASIMFLSQSFYNTPKIIWKNVNYVVILKLNGTRDMNSLLREVSIGLTKEQLLEMYKEATKIKFDAMIINLEESGNERYRKNFLEYFEIE